MHNRRSSCLHVGWFQQYDIPGIDPDLQYAQHARLRGFGDGMNLYVMTSGDQPSQMASGLFIFRSGRIIAQNKRLDITAYSAEPMLQLPCPQNHTYEFVYGRLGWKMDLNDHTLGVSVRYVPHIDSLERVRSTDHVWWGLPVSVLAWREGATEATVAVQLFSGDELDGYERKLYGENFRIYAERN